MKRLTRRQFVRGSLAVGATLLLPRSVLGANETINIGVIGLGGRGTGHAKIFGRQKGARVVSLAEPDRKRLDRVHKLFPDAKALTDLRKMIEDKDVDAVVIATCNHWHALPMIEAVKSGADVYVQKPISVDIVEGQAMLKAARKYKRVVQVGTQRRSTPHIIEARDRIIKEGKLGKIGLVEIYCYYHMRARGNPPDTEPPEYLDYEMWTGPAPMRPYNKLIHPRRWRSFMEYSNGIIGDMCIHMLDMTRWMLDLGWPRRVASTGGILVDKESKANISDTQTATFEFDDLSIVWQHRTWGHSADPKYPWGATFYGDKGTLKVSVYSYDFIPRGKGKPIHRDVVYELEKYPEDKTEKGLEKHVAPAIRKHMRDFLAAIAARSRPVADIEEGYISTASCILANLALDTRRTLAWDPEAGRIKDDEEANRLLRRRYRSPWIHPEPDRV